MRWFLLLSLSLSQACTIYQSVGRKDFESRSPSYVRSQAFIGCEPVEEPTPAWVEKFKARELYSDARFWVAEETQVPHLIQVYDTDEKELCSYQYSSAQDWGANKTYFFDHLE